MPLGEDIPNAQNVVLPADSGAINVTEAPYFAKGDGITDDTAAIQAALNNHRGGGQFIYFPNGIYKISDTLNFVGDARQIVLQGQSMQGAVIQLMDNLPAFQNPRSPKAMLITGYAPAQRFGNELRNLTFDSGVKNPGATGVRFNASNHGGISDCRIHSGDGQGVIGLDMKYTDEIGPLMVKNLTVLGFDNGVVSGGGVNSQTFDLLKLNYQNVAGFRNEGQVVAIGRLYSVSRNTAVVTPGGFTTIVTANLRGVGTTSSTQPAILNGAGMLARNVTTTGYLKALQTRGLGVSGVETANISQWLSKPAVSLFDSPGEGLNLPIRYLGASFGEGDLTKWASVAAFGAIPNDGVDDSDAIQAAIDSGAPVVYFPLGSYDISKTVVLRGALRRITGFKPFLNIASAFYTSGKPVFSVGRLSGSSVELDSLITDFSSGSHFFLENNQTRTVILRHMGINFQGADAYRGNSTGAVFIEDVVGRTFKFTRQTVWARQFNVESLGTHTINDGGKLWILGQKTETNGTLIETKNGGKTEVLGALAYSFGGNTEPMYTCDATSQVAITVAEVNFSFDSYPVVVRQTKNGETREITRDDPRWGGSFALFTSGVVPTPTPTPTPTP